MTRRRSSPSNNGSSHFAETSVRDCFVIASVPVLEVVVLLVVSNGPGSSNRSSCNSNSSGPW